MKNFIVLIFLLISVKAYGQASPAVIFNAGYGKVIPEFGLRFKDNKTLISGAANPSVTATDAPIGSIYISSNGLTYQKQDNGSTTNWTPLYFVPIFTDDNRLVRTDGTDNVQQSGVTLSDTDAMTGLTSLDVDLINIDSYIISTTATDQALELNPNGTGTVDIPYLTNGAALFAGSNGAISQDFANYQYSTLDGLKVDNIRLNGNTVSSDNLNGNINLTPNGTGDVVVSTLTNGRVVYNSTGALVDDSQFSYNDSTKVLRVDGVDIGGSNTITTHSLSANLTLDAHGSGIVDVNAPINLESVTANQVAFSDGISGNIVGNANFTYDSLVNSLTAGALNFIDGIISSTAINGNVTISPDGTGEVDVTAPLNIDNGVSISGSTISGANAAADLVIAPAALRQIELTGDTEINNLFFPAAVGSGAYVTTNLNQDITLAADGTGELSVLTPAEIEQVRIQDNAITTNVLDGNVTLLANGTGDATVTYGTNELSLDPSRTDDNLLRNGDFENGIVEYSCTNATGAIVDTTAPTQNNAKMFQMTVSVIGGYCDFTVTTGAALEGILFRIAGQFQTSLAGVEYCTLVNGAVDNCIPVSAKATWTDPLATQSQAGATSVAIRVRSTLATGVINADKFNLKIGGLPTGPTVSCNGDLDCENEFTGYYDASEATLSEAVKAQTPSTWITNTAKSDTSNSVKTFTVPSGIFSLAPNCTTAGNGPSETAGYVKTLSTGTSLVFRTRASTTDLDLNFSFECTKDPADFKPIIQQGVVNVGTSNAMELVVSSESVVADQTVGAATVTVDFPDVHRSRGISWNTSTDEGTFLESGKVKLSANVLLYNNISATTWLIFPEIDTGSGYAIPEGVKAVSSFTSTTNGEHASPNAEFSFRVQAGNKVRLRVTSDNANSVLLGNAATRYQTMSIDSIVDQQTIAASTIDRKIYDGNEYLAGEIAVVGGVEKTVYRRCYELASTLSATTTIATIPTNLNILNGYFQTGVYFIQDGSRIVSSSDTAEVRYTQSTGVLNYVIVGQTVSAGMKFCIRYYK